MPSYRLRLTIALLLPPLLAACVETVESTGADPMTRTAETACLSRAHRVSNRSDLYVVRSEYSEANTLVIVGDPDGNRYQCRASNAGAVAEFSAV